MPKAKAFQSELDGLLKMYRSVHGAVANAPNRKHPFLPEYWNKIDALKDGQALAGRPAWSPTTRRLDRVMLRMGRVMRRTANRAREFLEGRDKDQISWMTRASATYRLSGVIVTDPTPAQLAPEKRRVGDLVYLVMPHTKADKTGERNCPFPCILPYDGTSSCAAAGIMDQELEEPCHGRDQRERTPLFADERGNAYSYYTLSRELYLLLRPLLGENLAKLLSWHSIRIGTACALHAVGCPDEVIQLLCRWACPESLLAYRRLNTREQVEWMNKAAHAKYDTLQAAHLPVLDNDVQAAAATFELSRQELEHALSTVQVAEELPELQADASAQTPTFVVPPPQKEGVWTAGDYAMVPASIYPSYPCSELGGSGWLVRILQVRGVGADTNVKLYFEHARTSSGRHFEEVLLQASVLRPVRD